MPPRLSISTPSRHLGHHLTRSHHQPRLFSSAASWHADFTHVIIGGGVVGLAIARQLQSHPDARTLLLERHRTIGTETSSRNSEVIHAGLYYGADSLKTKLCLKGKIMLYDLCEKYDIPYRNCGKWIVAQNEAQMGVLEKVNAFAESIGVPMKFVSLEEGKRREPDVRAERGILESPSTGILDSHSYMQFLQGDFEERGGECAFHSPVTHIEALDQGRRGWKVFSGNGHGDEDSAIITADTLINSAGLAACTINNMIMPPSRHRKPFYAKGTYYSYSASHPRPTTLVYPAPTPGHGGLGTHLTLDIAGRVRFGPDVEWVDDPGDLAPNPKGFERALDDIETYLPGLRRESVGLDYCGIRPKLSRTHSAVSGDGFLDFYIEDERKGGLEGFVNLMGIESPGLTSSLAIAEYVEELLYR